MASFRSGIPTSEGSTALRMCFLCAGILLTGGVAWSEGESPRIAVDELPRVPIELPDGSKTSCVRYLGRLWRECSPAELQRQELENTDVCFEAKFAELRKNRLHLHNQKLVVVCDNVAARRAGRILKRLDNVWFVGTLRRSRNRKTLELHLFDFVRLPADLKRFEIQMAAFLKRGDGDALIELGHRIAAHQREIGDFGEFGKLAELKMRCWKKGLELKAKQLPPDDAEGRFALAQQWLSLLNKRAQYRKTVLQTLRIDPNHPGAARIAAEDFGYVKFEGRWMAKSERERILAERRAARERSTAAEKQKRARFNARVRRAVKERERRLLVSLAALRVSDPKRRDAALASFGEAARDALEPIFAERAVRLLAEVPDGEAVRAGLGVIVHSPEIEVRREVYEALAWRADNNSLDLLTASLSSEKDFAALKAGANALAALRSRPAAEALFRILKRSEPRTEKAVVSGLKNMLRPELRDKKQWLQWWAAHEKDKRLPFRIAP